MIKKSREHGYTDNEILHHLCSQDFDRRDIFHRIQSFHGVAILFQTTSDPALKAAAGDFLRRYKEGDLPLLNQVESPCFVSPESRISFSVPCAPLQIAKVLESTPEIERFVDPPDSYSLTYVAEVAQHHRSFEILTTLPEEQLSSLLTQALDAEAKINDDFSDARKNLTDTEKQMLGFEIYGDEGRHYAFKGNIGTWRSNSRNETRLPQRQANEEETSGTSDALLCTSTYSASVRRSRTTSRVVSS